MHFLAEVLQSDMFCKVRSTYLIFSISEDQLRITYPIDSLYLRGNASIISGNTFDKGTFESKRFLNWNSSAMRDPDLPFVIPERYIGRMS